MASDLSSNPPRAIRRRAIPPTAHAEAGVASRRRFRTGGSALPEISGGKLSRADIDAVLSHPCWHSDN